jgi:hypothetical protein
MASSMRSRGWLVFVGALVVMGVPWCFLTTVSQHTCLVATQADPLGGLSTSGIPAQCAAQFHVHLLHGLIVAAGIATLAMALTMIWTTTSRCHALVPADAGRANSPNHQLGP